MGSWVCAKLGRTAPKLKEFISMHHFWGMRFNSLVHVIIQPLLLEVLVSASAQLFFNILTVVAIIVGPIAAIQIQEHLEEGRERRRRKSRVFRELMVTRSTVLSPRHVEALNGIQVEFSSREPTEKQVIDAWQNYINHLNNHNDSSAWSAQTPELLAELLLQMAICLGYHDFNKARIKSEAYTPRYFAEIEAEQNDLRKAAVEVFRGRQQLKVAVTEQGSETPATNPVAPRRPS